MKVPVPDQLAALAHPKRLDVFRLLMRRYPDAVPAGEIANALDLRANTTSVYLTALRHAGLISQTRQGTYLLYQVRMDQVQEMFGAMLVDCCQNRPDLRVSVQSPKRARLAEGPAAVHVLFVCSHNSARSIMAEALLNNQGPRFRASSAGTDPAASPNPIALEILSLHGLDISGLSSQSLDHFLAADGPPMDMVITVCDQAANKDCGHWPGTPVHAHWSLRDPMADLTEAARRAAMQNVFTVIGEKIDALVHILEQEPDLTTLQANLDHIGHMHIRL